MSAGARRVLVIGSSGQDGSILIEHASRVGDMIVGLDASGLVFIGDAARWGSPPPTADIEVPRSMEALVSWGRFDEVYYLAAHHTSSDEAGASMCDPTTWHRSWSVHCQGLVHTLNALAGHAPTARLVYASSCLAFGDVDVAPQTESTPLCPIGPYGVTKAAGMGICASYRARGLHASVAILYNHESPRRRPGFVTQRVARAVASAVHDGGQRVMFRVKDPEAVVDWISAEDAVRALRAIAASDAGGAFVVAGGRARSVRELCEAAAAHRGLAAEIVQEGEKAMGRKAPLIGDAGRLHRMTGWEPRVTFETWVGQMVDAAIAAGPSWGQS